MKDFINYQVKLENSQIELLEMKIMAIEIKTLKEN
jgi:hypothetical protein